MDHDLWIMDHDLWIVDHVANQPDNLSHFLQVYVPIPVHIVHAVIECIQYSFFKTTSLKYKDFKVVSLK